MLQYSASEMPENPGNKEMRLLQQKVLKMISEHYRILFFFMDFEQALFYLEKVDRRIRFENFTVSDEVKYELWQFYAYVSVYMRDLPKALEISEGILQIAEKKKNRRMRFYAYYIRSVIYMYQSKLQGCERYTTEVEVTSLVVVFEVGPES